MSRSKKNSTLEKNLNRIFLIKPKIDRKGEYIPYCDNYHHRGVIGNGKAKECEARGCVHYRVFREER